MSDYTTRNTDMGLGETGSGANEEIAGSENAGMKEMKDRLQEKAQQARDMAAEKMTQARDSVSRMSQDVSGKLRDSLGRVRSIDQSEMNAMYDDVLEGARRNPGRAILISAGVGMVLGMILKGNQRND